MNYLFYRRIRGPIYLLTFGVTAALAQWHVLSFSRSWPLYLIVAGVLRLVETAMLAADPTPLYPPQGFAPTGYPPQGTVVSPSPAAVPGTGLAHIAPAPLSSAAGYTAVPEEKS